MKKAVLSIADKTAFFIVVFLNNPQHLGKF